MAPGQADNDVLDSIALIVSSDRLFLEHGGDECQKMLSLACRLGQMILDFRSISSNVAGLDEDTAWKAMPWRDFIILI